VNEWLGVNDIVVSTVVGLLGLLFGIIVSRWQGAARNKQLIDAHEAQLQATQQELAQMRQRAKAAQSAAAAAEDQQLQQERALTAKEEELRIAQEELRLAADAQAQLPLRIQELQEVGEALQKLQGQHHHLQAQVSDLESTLRAKENSLAQSVAEATSLQGRVAALQAEAASQLDALTTVQSAHNHEVALRQRITSEIAHLYQSLQNGMDPSAPKENGSVDSERKEPLPNENGTPPDSSSTSLIPPVEPTGEPDEVSRDTGTETPDIVAVKDNEQSANKIEQFLAERGITIKHLPAEAESDSVLNTLASYLGSNYESVKPLYQQIKRNMQLGDDFAISLKGEPPDVISRICQFGKKLHEMAFLEQYRYIRSPHYLLKAKTTRLSTAQNFFSGQWLERYIVQQVQAAINTIRSQTEKPVAFDYLANPKIVLANGQDGELDLIFQVNETIYWIESKSGDYQQHISKYSMIAKTLNLDVKHALMVLTDIPASRSNELTALFHMGVCSLGDFDKELMATLSEELL